jgi:hypothetical protein
MNRPARNTQTINQTQVSEPSKLRRIKPTAITAAIFLCGLVVSALFMGSIAQAQTDVSQLVLQHPGWIHVPGALVRPDCMHEIPNGASVKVENGRDTGDVTMKGIIVAHYEPCSEDAVVRLSQGESGNPAISDSTGNGVVEASYWNYKPRKSSDDICYLYSSVTVPSNPSENGATIFLYSAVVSSTGTYDFVPALQYGSNGPVGGNYWVAVTYFTTPTNEYYSTAETVNVGDLVELFADIYDESGGVLYWQMSSQDLNNGALSEQTDTTSGVQWTEVDSGALEVNDVTSCSNFPASGKAIFSAVRVEGDYPTFKLLSPKWTGKVYSYGGPSCSFKVVPGKTTTLDF